VIPQLSPSDISLEVFLTLEIERLLLVWLETRRCEQFPTISNEAMLTPMELSLGSPSPLPLIPLLLLACADIDLQSFRWTHMHT
jgi:hypothetical protein